jgi:tetratricopeptide (TPR) repeat protein
VESELGDYLKAKQYYLESLDLCNVIGLKSGTAATLNNIGDIARETGDANEAREYLNRSIQAAIELGDQYIIAMALGNLGDVEYRTGKLEVASQYLKQSLEVCNLTNDNLGAAYTLSIMGNVAVAQGDFPQAAEYFYTALRYDAENDVVPQLLQTAIGLAELNYRSGRLQDALEMLYLSRDHPAVSRFYRQDAVKLIRLIEAELPGEAVREIQEHVAGLDEQATIQHILQAAPQAP